MKAQSDLVFSSYIPKQYKLPEGLSIQIKKQSTGYGRVSKL